MEAITATIVAALVAGATAASKDVGTTAIKEAYAGLKRLIKDGYEQAGSLVEAVEADPASKPEQEALAKQLGGAGAAPDDNLKNCAQKLLKEVEALRQEPEAAALFDFDQLHAAGKFELENIETIGTVLRAKKATFENDFKATGLHQQKN